MSDFEEVEISRGTPRLAPPYRRRIRAGFGLFAAALGLVLVCKVLSSMALLIANPAGADLDKAQSATWNLWSLVVEGVTAALLLAGVIALYRVPIGERSRWATTLLLAMCGADIAFMGLRAVGDDSNVVTLSETLALALGWIELWMIAVVAAEAAEAAARPDLTYQTEVIGKLVICGGFIWLLFSIWSFDFERLSASATVAPDGLTTFLGFGSMLFHLVAIARTAMCCVGLVGAYTPLRDEATPS